MQYDAILLVSFGGPERHEDVIPFLENVLRGRNVPRERMLEVAEHYYHFDGKSPINDHCRALIALLRDRVQLPVYWGNRNWHPMLGDTFRQMESDGVRRALAIATSAYSSYSACRQYIDNIEASRGAIEVHKLPPFCGRPGFLDAMAARVQEAVDRLPGARLVFTAHSVPVSMAVTSRYEQELRATAAEVSDRLGIADWDLVWQSRSGPPTQPWLVPDILDHLRDLSASGVQRVVVAPIGFLSDHMEVMFDLDYEAAGLARDLGIKFVRAATVGTHPRFIDMLSEAVAERLSDAAPLVCPPGCCPAPVMPGRLRPA